MMFSDYFATRKSGPRKDSTCWNRRSNAASFSTYFLYSSKVVAPMHRSWPRASIGFKRFAASIDPSVRPNQSTIIHKVVKSICSLCCYWNDKLLIKKRLLQSSYSFALLQEWEALDQEKTSQIKVQFVLLLEWEVVDQEKDYWNQVCSLHCYWNENFLIKKRLRKSSLQFALLLSEWEVLDQENSLLQSSCSLHCYWNEYFFINKDLEFAAPGMRFSSWSRKE